VEIRTENWFPEKEVFTKPAEIEIHNLLHEKKSHETRTEDMILNSKRVFRYNALERILKSTGKTLSGKVLEVGAGDGWCSAYIMRTKNIEEIHVMECNKPAAAQLIPNTFKFLDIPTDKVTFVQGSFNYIKHKNYYDSIVAMGALHHSSNLFHTLKEIYNALKPGAFLVAQEPFMHDDTPNSFFFERESREINFWDVKTLKNDERTDLFYRECEYRSAAYHAGFNVNIVKLKENEKKSFFKRFSSKETYSLTEPSNMVFLFEKPLNNTDLKPPTSWEK